MFLIPNVGHEVILEKQCCWYSLSHRNTSTARMVCVHAHACHTCTMKTHTHARAHVSEKDIGPPIKRQKVPRESPQYQCCLSINLLPSAFLQNAYRPTTLTTMCYFVLGSNPPDSPPPSQASFSLVSEPCCFHRGLAFGCAMQTTQPSSCEAPSPLPVPGPRAESSSRWHCLEFPVMAPGCDLQLPIWVLHLVWRQGFSV